MPTGNESKSLGLLALAGLTPYQEKDGEEYMNEAQMEHFRRILSAWRDQLRQEVDHTVHHMQRWLCMFCVNECADVHNDLRAQRREEAGRRLERKRARVARAQLATTASH